MADVIYKKGKSSELDKVAVKNGQILVTEDTGEMYIDMSDNSRKKISDNNKIEAWNVNRTYKPGDIVVFIDIPAIGISFDFAQCKIEHTSPETWGDVVQMIENGGAWEIDYIERYWSVWPVIVDWATSAATAITATYAEYDSNENRFVDHYATKDELNFEEERTFQTFVLKETFNETVGNIETALDEIIAIQNNLIGGNE